MIDVSLFIYIVSSLCVYLLVYLDDILVMGNDQSLINALLLKLSTAFKIRDLGPPNFSLGIETIARDDYLVLSQKRYVCDILKCAGMVDCVGVFPFKKELKVQKPCPTLLP